MSKTCFFIGHREAPSELAPILAKEVEHHIVEYGVSSFIVGMYGNFDHMAAGTVIAAKVKHPQIRLSLLIPYHPAERKIVKPDGIDELYYPDGLEGVPRKYAIIKANRKIISQSDYLIAYVVHPASNAIQFLEYALRLEKRGKIHVCNIGHQNN